MTQRELPTVTGAPDLRRAREIAREIINLPESAGEEEVRQRTRELLGRLFPLLTYPEIATQRNAGDGYADVVCRNLVVETKARGKMDEPRLQPDGSSETPKEQLTRYLAAITRTPEMFYTPDGGWRGLITDGLRWDFYAFDPSAYVGERLRFEESQALTSETHIDGLLINLIGLVDNKSKIAPPVNDATWANTRVKGFVDLATSVSSEASFEMKLRLWRDMLQGAFITSPSDADAEVKLFASHTMLVLISRTVSAIVGATPSSNEDTYTRNSALAEGFASWLIDVGGEEGDRLINALVEDVNRYEWRRSERDNLKDLYHSLIPREVRHDFGEYYTPDWLARAVCEEVLDEEWRQQVVEEAVVGTLTGPAVLDPSCGSGTFLYHASQLLMETAEAHPELADKPAAQVEVVNMLVAGMDLHPVAVELAKTTKALAFAGKAGGRIPDDEPNVFLGDSLQWSLKSDVDMVANLVEVPTGDDDPILLPRSLVMSDRFTQLLGHMFDRAAAPADPHVEDNLLAVLQLNLEFERQAVLKEFRRFQRYIQTGRNHVWRWFVSNLVQPLRLGQTPMTRLVGNPPWVVYNKISTDRQERLRDHAHDRHLWAGGKLAPHNDLAATFVATCVDEYLAGGGRFGFVMPYATLKARQWEPFRTGNWSSCRTDSPTNVDLSGPAWDMTGVNAPPFSHANSSVTFGTKLNGDMGRQSAVPMRSIMRVSGDGVEPSMGWSEVKPKAKFTPAPQWPSEASEEYASRFRQGATLVPQSLVLFDSDDSEEGLRGNLNFITRNAKRPWDTLQGPGTVESRFVLPAVFSKHIVPFGTTGHHNLIAPVIEDRLVADGLPEGHDARFFREYWANADMRYQHTRRPRSAPTLQSQIDYQGKLSARLARLRMPCVVYNRSGSWLSSAVVAAGNVVDSTLYWFSSNDRNELHFLSAVFNAPALAIFLKEVGRKSDRDFHTGPIQSLPIPAYDASDSLHQVLATASRRAHTRVSKLTNPSRVSVLADRYVKRHLSRIDEAVRELFPDYCTDPD